MFHNSLIDDLAIKGKNLLEKVSLILQSWTASAPYLRFLGTNAPRILQTAADLSPSMEVAAAAAAAAAACIDDQLVGVLLSTSAPEAAVGDRNSSSTWPTELRCE